MAYWSKFTYEKSTYIIDLDTISAFSSELDNKRITFWLPNSSQPIILNPQGNYEAYKQVLDYLKKTIDRNSKGSWIKINYDRKEFAIDMSRISSFSCEQNGRLISFYLPDSTTNIILMREGNSDDYQRIQEYIKNTTGHSLP
ncbi:MULTISPECIES: hypothetical protein [unclassified Microcoleus]|uniref:hypothetical protein n=1 Tax=unclassified Microcoleus TaxID=2642155 RepID=UPI002FCF3C51